MSTSSSSIRCSTGDGAPRWSSSASASVATACTSSTRQLETDIGAGSRSARTRSSNFLRTGGLAGADEPVSALAVRTSYFREEYAYGNESRIDGIEPFLHHAAFVEAARAIHGRPVIEPAIVYANLMVPGQELAVHTDVPEFRGANRKLVPQWLLVVMLHSGLLRRVPHADRDRHRVVPRLRRRRARVLARRCRRPRAARTTVRFNTAMVLDTDTVFHGVERIADVAVDDLPRLRPGMTLDRDG